MTRRRGRPPRADAPASCRVEVGFTPAELARVARLAKVNKLTVIDMIRVGILTLAADLDDGADPPVVLGGHVGPIICPD